MKLGRVFYKISIVYFITLASVGMSGGNDKPIQQGLFLPKVGDKLISPDNKIALSMDYNHGNNFLCFDRIQSQTTIDCIIPEKPISALYWCGDSKHLMMITESQNMNQAKLLTIIENDVENERFVLVEEIIPPSIGDDTVTVINCVPKDSGFALSYAVVPCIEINDEQSIFQYNFNFNPKSGTYTQFTSKEISSKEYEVLKLKYRFPKSH